MSDQEIAEALDRTIRLAAADMLQAQRLAARSRSLLGAGDRRAHLAMIDMAVYRGVFLGLVEAYEVVLGGRYPALAEVQSGWLDRP